MFKSLVFYIVEPTSELARLCESDEGLWECLSETMFWTDQEGGQTLMTVSQRIFRFKILALAFFLSEFKSLNAALGNPQLDEKTFDQYWNVKRLEPEGTVEQLSHDASEVVQQRFKMTGDKNLDTWIQDGIVSG